MAESSIDEVLRHANAAFAQLVKTEMEDAIARLAEASGFQIQKLSRWDATTRRMVERHYWAARTGKAPQLLGLGLDLQAHRGFDSRAAAARDALGALTAELQRLLER